MFDLSQRPALNSLLDTCVCVCIKSLIVPVLCLFIFPLSCNTNTLDSSRLYGGPNRSLDGVDETIVDG